MKSWQRICGLVAVVGCVLAIESGAGTSDVFVANVLLNGVTQWYALTNPIIQEVQLNVPDLINLGLGQPLTAVIPHNQQLGLVKACGSNDMRLIVYDTDTSSNLATIGNMPNISTIYQVRRRQHTQNMISELTLNFAPSVTNGLAGGVMFVNGLMNVDTNDCLTHYNGKITGVLGASFYFTNIVYVDVVDLTVTNLTTNSFFVVSNFPVNVSSSLISTGRKLGTLIEP
jgi:hypothetical protein